MRIHKEGWPSILIVFTLCLFLTSVVFYLTSHSIIRQVTVLFSFGLLSLVLQFFRNPRRKLVQYEKGIVAPADGKIVVIEKVFEEEYLKEECTQVSIFMSPFNVHINRYPVSGVIEYYRYHPGLYLVAWHPKSSSKNERTTIVIRHHDRRVLFRQIAGVLARRIKFYGKPNDQVVQAQECGFIKFGSRIDIFLPLSAKIQVSLNQQVKGGQTIIAEW